MMDMVMQHPTGGWWLALSSIGAPLAVLYCISISSSSPLSTADHTYAHMQIRKFDKDHKEKVAQKAAAAVNKKRKADGEAEGGEAAAEGEAGKGGEEKKEPKVYEFDIPENFEAELKGLIPRHVKFQGIKPNTPYYELRDFLAQHGEVSK